MKDDGYILVTRARHQASHLCRLIELNGGRSLLFPTIEIKPLAVSTAMKAQIRGADYLIFLSANAVSNSREIAFSASSKVIAIGPATARALEAEGVRADFLPAHYNTQGLLQLPELLRVSQKKIILVCGKNSPEMLKSSLIMRGGNVLSLECYQRCPPRLSVQQKLDMIAKPIHVIIVSSLESLKNLCAALANYSDWLRNKPLVVVNDAMKKFAIDYGWVASITISRSATDEAIIDTLKSKEK